MTRERAGALLVLSDSMLIVQRERIADLAAKNRLPAVYGLRLHAEAGGLMAYGANLLDLVRLHWPPSSTRSSKARNPLTSPSSNQRNSSW